MKKKAVWTAGVVAAVLVVIMLFIWFRQKSTPELHLDELQAIKVEVIHSDGSQQTFTYDTDASTLEDVLVQKGLISGEESSYGLYVTTVDGESADYQNNKSWWKLSINDEDATTGVSQTPVVDGYIYTWSYVQD